MVGATECTGCRPSGVLWGPLPPRNGDTSASSSYFQTRLATVVTVKALLHKQHATHLIDNGSAGEVTRSLENLINLHRLQAESTDTGKIGGFRDTIM